jgi:hypothetical protein
MCCYHISFWKCWFNLFFSFRTKHATYRSKFIIFLNFILWIWCQFIFPRSRPTFHHWLRVHCCKRGFIKTVVIQWHFMFYTKWAIKEYVNYYTRSEAESPANFIAANFELPIPIPMMSIPICYATSPAEHLAILNYYLCQYLSHCLLTQCISFPRTFCILPLLSMPISLVF